MIFIASNFLKFPPVMAKTNNRKTILCRKFVSFQKNTSLILFYIMIGQVREVNVCIIKIMLIQHSVDDSYYDSLPATAASIRSRLQYKTKIKNCYYYYFR